MISKKVCSWIIQCLVRPCKMFKYIGISCLLPMIEDIMWYLNLITVQENGFQKIYIANRLEKNKSCGEETCQ